MKAVDAPMYIAILSSAIAVDIANILPETDLCDELRNIMHIQYEILNMVAEEIPIDKARINIYINYLENMLEQVIKIRIGK